MSFTVHWRYLLKCAAILVIGAVGVHRAHSWQVQKQVRVFLHHADRARDAGQREKEVHFLKRYLMARPDDLDTRERLARSMCQTAKSGMQLMEAHLFMENVLRRDPDRDELRRFAIDFAMDLRIGLFSEAQGHIAFLLNKRPADGELEGLYARTLESQRKYQTEGDNPGAVDWYSESIKHRPDLIESYASRAAILRLHLNQPDDAHQTIADMLKANPINCRAYICLARYWQALAKPQQAAEMVAKPIAVAQQLAPGVSVSAAITAAVAEAQKHGPEELDVILLAAEVARARTQALTREGKTQKAQESAAETRQLLARAVELHPKSIDAYLATASLDADTRSAAEAVAVIRKGLDAVPDAPELIVALLDYQIRAGDAAGANETLDQLRMGGLPPALADYQRARVLALQDNWLDAALILDQIRQELPNDPSLARQVNLLLGRCYAQIGEDDRRLEAYKRALPDDSANPLWVAAMFGVAEAEATLGWANEALATYRRLKGHVPEAWIQVVRLEMIRALQSPSGKRDWKPSAEALTAAERVYHDLPEDRVPTDLRLLRVDLLSFQNKLAEARKEIEVLRAKRPKEVAVWVAVAQQDLRDKNPQQAVATLAAAQKEIDDSPDLRLAWARLWVEMKEPDLAGKFTSLTAGSEKFPRLRQRQLLRELAGIAMAAGAGDVAGRLWEQLAAVQRDDLGVHLIRFDRALQSGNEVAAEGILGEIRRVEGESGSFTRLGRAVLLIARAQKNKEMVLDEALGLLDGLSRERPRWARVAMSLALVYDLRGDLDAALGKYRDAVAYGETNPEALRRLLELLHAKGRFSEAEEILRKLQDAAASGPDVQRLAAEVYLRTGNSAGAMEAAAKAVPLDSKNPRDQLWLGQMHWAAGERAKAEAPLRKAVELAPSSQETWLVLIQYLAATNRIDEGTKTLELAKDRVDRGERSLFHAMAYIQLRMPEKATEAFRKARAERPDHLRTAQAEAEFLFQLGQLAEAREAFQRVIGMQSASAEDKDFARRMIAIALAADRDYETSRKALEAIGLVDNGSLRQATGAETSAQRRTRAVVLALQKDRASKLEAIRLLEEDASILAPSDQFLIVQLHVAVGNRPQVRVVMADLLRKPEAAKVSLYLAFYAGWLLREGDVPEAEEWVKQLEKNHPNAFQTAELKARLFAAKKDLGSARAILLAKADPSGAPVAALARICEEIGLNEDAERLLKRFVQENQAARPQTPLTLAAFYGRLGRTADALRVCEGVSHSVPTPAVGAVEVRVLYAASIPSPADAGKVGAWLEEAAGKARGESRAALLQQLASVRNLQGNYAAAVELYRRALAENGKDALAMNNLAYLLSAREGKHDDALRLLDQAKKAIGPHLDLLDTEAIVRLNKGEVDTARKLLEEVVVAAPNASGYFHLAQVELAAKRNLEARLAWQRSRELELHRADLHPLEREAYDRVADLMK
jgi:tetratricopeptide (TPR) repeat protein